MLLTCVAYGLPTPEISWTVGGETLVNDTRVTIYNEIVEEGGVLFSSSVLEICSVELEDAGQYACVASNEEANDTVSFELTVLSAGGRCGKTSAWNGREPYRLRSAWCGGICKLVYTTCSAHVVLTHTSGSQSCVAEGSHPSALATSLLLNQMEYSLPIPLKNAGPILLSPAVCT